MLVVQCRKIEDNEKNKNAAASEPLNSRTNKLLCECRARSRRRVWVEPVTGIINIYRIAFTIISKNVFTLIFTFKNVFAFI